MQSLSKYLPLSHLSSYDGVKWQNAYEMKWDEYIGICDVASDYWHSAIHQEEHLLPTSADHVYWNHEKQPCKEKGLLYPASTSGQDLSHTHQWPPKASMCTSLPSSPSVLLKSSGTRSPQRGRRMSTWLWWPGVLEFLDTMCLKQLKKFLEGYYTQEQGPA